CEAEIYELEGSNDAAIDSYNRAIQHGERNFEIYRRVLNLLFARNDLLGATAVLRSMPDPSSATRDLKQQLAKYDRDTGNGQRALSLAHEVVDSGSPNPRDHLWLGTLLAAVGLREQALASLREATNRGPDLPETWITLVFYQKAFDEKDQK